MKKIVLFSLLVFSLNSFGQYGYKKWYLSLGVTGKYMLAEKYTGYDFNLTFVPRYNFVEFNFENTLSIEARPQIGIGTRDWYHYGEYDQTFPTRFSYAIPVIVNYNWGLNAEESSVFVTGLYFGVGYNYVNVYSKEPPYDAIHGPVFDLGLRIDGDPISHVSFMYTYGLNGGRIYSLGFFYDF